MPFDREYIIEQMKTGGGRYLEKFDLAEVNEVNMALQKNQEKNSVVARQFIEFWSKTLYPWNGNYSCFIDKGGQLPFDIGPLPQNYEVPALFGFSYPMCFPCVDKRLLQNGM